MSISPGARCNSSCSLDRSILLERSLTQHFGPQERSIFLDRSETSHHPRQSRDQDELLVGVAYEMDDNVKFYR